MLYDLIIKHENKMERESFMLGLWGNSSKALSFIGIVNCYQLFMWSNRKSLSGIRIETFLRLDPFSSTFGTSNDNALSGVHTSIGTLKDTRGAFKMLMDRKTPKLNSWLHKRLKFIKPNNLFINSHPVWPSVRTSTKAIEWKFHKAHEADQISEGENFIETPFRQF